MMLAAEFRSIRASLGLSQSQLAKVLDYGHRTRIAAFEIESKTARQIPPLLERLMRAYAAGYRPADWPTG